MVPSKAQPPKSLHIRPFHQPSLGLAARRISRASSIDIKSFAENQIMLTITFFVKMTYIGTHEKESPRRKREEPGS